MSDEPQDDIRASLTSAIAADTAASEPAPSATPETSAVEPGVVAAGPTAPAEVEKPDTGTSEPARDERGRFAPKTDTAPADSPEPAKAEAPVATDEAQPAPKVDAERRPPLAPPQDWSDRSKVKWQQLPRSVQEDLLKVEAKGRYGVLHEIIEPYRQRFALKGQAPEQAIGALVAAWDGLENPETRLNTLRWLAHSYGIDPAQFAPPASGNGQANPAAPNGVAGEPEYVDPQVAALREVVSGLEQKLTQFASQSQQQLQAQEEQRRNSIASQVSAFRADPSHPHFDIVEGDIAALLRVNPGLDLQKAYDKAVWANDTVRETILAEQRMAEQERVKAEAKQRVDRAVAASGSVTGSPSPGASVSVTPNTDLRAMLTEQVMAHARV